MEKQRLFHAKELPEGWSEYPFTLTGYRVNLSCRSATWSVFNQRHNEFWMIWSDIFPAAVFTVLLALNTASEQFKHRSLFFQFLVVGVFLAVIICRICSSLYHVYNCISLGMNKTMIKVDLIGICFMSLGSPWIFAVANKTETGRDHWFLMYTALLLSSFIGCVLFTRQHFIIVLAAIGNYPALQIGMDQSFPTIWRLLSLLAVGGFLLGYSVFYVLRFPECLLTLGSADGQIWNSHVIWHVIASLSQHCYVVTTFL